MVHCTVRLQAYIFRIFLFWQPRRSSDSLAYGKERRASDSVGLKNPKTKKIRLVVVICEWGVE